MQGKEIRLSKPACLPLCSMKNYLGQTLGLVLLVAVFLTGLSLLPEGLSFDGIPLRKMDIFSDIRDKDLGSQMLDSNSTNTDSLLEPLSPATAELDSPRLVRPVDPALYGKIFEDYTPEQQGLDRFFAAVEAIKTKGHTVRVAFFGDSFVEGDILLGDLRDTLQTVWGGNGVGYVPITSEVARFKRTLVHRYEKWNTYSIVKNSRSKQPFGINGFVYRPKAEAFVHYEGADYFHHTSRWTQVRLFYQADSVAHFVWQNLNGPPQLDSLPASFGKLGVWTWNQGQPSIRAFALRFDEPDSSLLLYGATLESGPGFYLDNFSVRGNSGGRLKLVQPALAQEFDAVQHYELIVVQLGLNAATPDVDNLDWYRAELHTTFSHLRKCFPDKLILVISVADRAGKIDGELGTLPAVPTIANMQRELAIEHGFLFYDLYLGMGGPGAMIDFADQRVPALANKDYTHLTHAGGKFLGYKFAQLFLKEQERYKSKPKAQRREENN